MRGRRPELVASARLVERGTMMRWDERIWLLLRAASRAEGDGDQKIARLFRRMAEDARPLNVSVSLQTE